MARRFCEQCGASVREDSKFCASCGSKINSGNNPSSDEQIVGAEVSAQNTLVAKVKHQYEISENGIVLQSAAPIPSKTGWATWAYIGGILAGIIIDIAVTFFVLAIVFIIEHFMMQIHCGKLRDMKFKFVSPISADEIFEKLQPALLKKYGSKIDFEREGETISVMYDDYIYDINLCDDGTVCIWWRKSLMGAMFSFNDWKKYRKVRTGTALVAYELQQQFGIR